MWPLATLKGCLRWVWGGRERCALVQSTGKIFFFVFCFLALFFLLFLFFSAPVNVVFLLLLFSAVLFVVLFRPFMCVCCYCCLVVFVFGRDKYNFLVLRFLSVLFFCVVGFFQDRYVCCYFCCVVFCILFAVLFRPVSLFRCSFRSGAVVFGIAYAMPW